MAKLAIKGHATRGNEVIEILAMLGGKNIYNYDGKRNMWYILEDDTIVTDFDLNKEKGFTLEEFLEKFPYKVGDNVKCWIDGYRSVANIKDIHWDSIPNEIKYKIGDYWHDALNLEPFEEETMEEGVYAYNEINCYHQDFADKVRIRLGGDYEIKVEEGKTYIVKKKPIYPKTYEECCGVLGMTYDYPDIRDVSSDEYNLYSNFIQLIRCRDAYWRIAGKEMGLGKPWKPDFEPNDEGEWQERYGIYIAENKIEKDCWGGGDINIILTFPTEEILYDFYENFKELIEQCKELL